MADDFIANKTGDPERDGYEPEPNRWWPEHWAPPWVILWRLVWVGPAMLFRAMFVACIFAGWGWRDAKAVWEWSNHLS